MSITSSSSSTLANSSMSFSNEWKQKSPRTSVIDWNAAEVMNWINEIGFGFYGKSRFMEQDITGKKLVRLSYEMMRNDLSITIVGHQLKILNSIYNLKKMHHVQFDLGDYIPESVYMAQNDASLNSFISDLKSNNEFLSRVDKEKDTQIGIVKAQFMTAKNELNYYRDLAMAKDGSLKSPYGIFQQSPTSPKKVRQGSIPNSPTASPLECAVRVFGNRLPGRQHESYKTFKLTPGDDCVKLILECLAKYKISSDWKEFMLLLIVNDQETVCLNPTDKVLAVCAKHLHQDLHEITPSFILQHFRSLNGPTTTPLNLDPGTFLAANLALTAITSAIGIYEYEAQSRLELDVHVGCKFSILARDGEWSVVERNGQRGSVPTCCIFEANPEKSRAANQYVFCVYDYNRRSKNELNVVRGDKLILLERYHHWCLVQHYNMSISDDEAVGLVPFMYLSNGDSATELKSLEPETKTRSNKRLSRLIVSEKLPHQPPTVVRSAGGLSTVEEVNSSNSSAPSAKSSQKSPGANHSPTNGLASPDEATRESFKSSVYELEKYLRQWENLLQDRQDDMPGSVKTLKDIRKLMQYVFSSSSPIHHIILKRPLSGIIAFTLDEVCKKNASRWLQYTNGSLHGMSQQDLDSILYSSIRKNYSSLMKIVNLVLEDSHVASLILKA